MRFDDSGLFVCGNINGHCHQLKGLGTGPQTDEVIRRLWAVHLSCPWWMFNCQVNGSVKIWEAYMYWRPALEEVLCSDLIISPLQLLQSISHYNSVSIISYNEWMWQTSVCGQTNCGKTWWTNIELAIDNEGTIVVNIELRINVCATWTNKISSSQCRQLKSTGWVLLMFVPHCHVSQ